MEKIYGYIKYENHNGGINNLQVLILKDENFRTLKTFTSICKKSIQYGKTWSKKNNYNYVV